MTDRPELDAWLAEADAVLDRNEYGQSWEADAMRARFDETGEPVIDGGGSWILDDMPVALASREGFGYFFPPAGQSERRIFHDGARVVDGTAARLWQRPVDSEEWVELGQVSGFDLSAVAIDVNEMAVDLAVCGEVLITVGAGVARLFGELWEAFDEAGRRLGGLAAAAADARVISPSAGPPAAPPLVETVRQHPLSGRSCPRHGVEMTAGQCRRCQRDDSRRAGRR